MEKVRPLCCQFSNRGRLKNRTEQCCKNYISFCGVTLYIDTCVLAALQLGHCAQGERDKSVGVKQTRLTDEDVPDVDLRLLPSAEEL